MRHTLLALLVLIVVDARRAVAEPPKVLVLQSDGRAPGAIRARVGKAILKLAQANAPQATAGDITYSDAAAAVGCNADDAACKDEVLAMLTVDEIVFATVTPKSGGLEIWVHRAAKDSAPRDARITVAAGQPLDRLDGIAPLFMAVVPTPAAPPTPTIDTSAPPVTTGGQPTAEPRRPPLLVPIDPVAAPAPATSAPKAPQPLAQPDDHAGRRRLEIIGMAGGGTMVAIGILLWGQTPGIQEQIDRAPNRTHANLEAIADLEQRGDSFAAWGNVLFVGGVIVGGISGYYFWKHRRAQRTLAAQITPTVFDHGIGIAFTLGGSP